jgi:hypothetical protein
MKCNEIDRENSKGVDIGSRPEWDGIRQKYKYLVDWFIATVKDLLGMILVLELPPSLVCLRVYSLQ